MSRLLFILLVFPFILYSQIVPTESDFNTNIVWQAVFSEGPPGKVNRGVVDSDGHCALIYMPENSSKVHKINGLTGELIWTKTIENSIGFGISEYNFNGRVDYIICGGYGSTQERWLARLNGDDGSIIWSKSYEYSGNSWQFDAIRMAIVGSDNYIYAAGFVGGDEANTIFVVYGGQSVVMKIDPLDGSEVWSNVNPHSEYAISLVESSSGYIYSAGTLYDENLTLTKWTKTGEEMFTESIANTDEIIPADLAISENDILYYGGHSGRSGEGFPFDYSCVSLDTNANVNWKKHYANPRNYSLDYIRNELYGVKVGIEGIYMFGGTGDESDDFSESSPVFLPSDVWNGWVLSVDWQGDIKSSHLFAHDNVNTATEYGDLIDGGFVIFNDTDAQGDTEVGVMKIITSEASNSAISPFVKANKVLVKMVDIFGREVTQNSKSPIFYLYSDGSAEKRIIFNLNR